MPGSYPNFTPINNIIPVQYYAYIATNFPNTAAAAVSGSAICVFIFAYFIPIFPRSKYYEFLVAYSLGNFYRIQPPAYLKYCLIYRSPNYKPQLFYEYLFTTRSHHDQSVMSTIKLSVLLTWKTVARL